MSIFDLFSTKKNKKEEQELKNLGLFKNERKEYKKGNYDKSSFEEEELEDDDYYYEDE